MTVREAKESIVAVLEALQKDGVWVKQVTINWAAIVEKDEKILSANFKCSVSLEAEL